MNRKLNYENVRYGMLVEVINESGIHAGCKVHFYNKKGVLIGNYYEFVPYEKLRIRKPNKNGGSRNYQRFFYRKRFERIKNILFRIPLRMVDFLIRKTQPVMD